MRDFEIKRINIDSSNKLFILCLSHQSIATYIDEIANHPLIALKTGSILIDQLLVTGDGDNRFIECHFSKGIIDFESMHNVIPTKEDKLLSLSLLQRNYQYLHNSILTDEQRYQIQSNHPI